MNPKFELINDIINYQKNISHKKLISQYANIVVTNDNANMALFVNTSPVCITFLKDEFEDFIKNSSALLLNMGTGQSKEWFLKPIKLANKFNVPVIFDPVGAGATRIRIDSANSIMKETNISVIRGNYSEILFCAGIKTQIKGVDSVADDSKVIEACKAISNEKNCVVVASGPVDYICYKEKLFTINYNLPILSSFTGSGCNLSAICASFIGNCIGKYDPFNIIVAAVSFYKYCGFVSQNKIKVKSFYIEHSDNLYYLDKISEKYWNTIIKKIK